MQNQQQKINTLKIHNIAALIGLPGTMEWHDLLKMAETAANEGKSIKEMNVQELTKLKHKITEEEIKNAVEFNERMLAIK